MNIDPRNHQSDRLVFHPTVHVIAVMALTTKFHERVDENTNGIERIDQIADRTRLYRNFRFVIG